MGIWCFDCLSLIKAKYLLARYVALSLLNISHQKTVKLPEDYNLLGGFLILVSSRIGIIAWVT
jgi:hypothetical protein